MKLKHKHSRKAGLPPGTLVHIGEKKSETVTISVYEYGEGQFQAVSYTHLTLPTSDLV